MKTAGLMHIWLGLAGRCRVLRRRRAGTSKDIPYEGGRFTQMIGMQVGQSPPGMPGRETSEPIWGKTR